MRFGSIKKAKYEFFLIRHESISNS